MKIGVGKSYRDVLGGRVDIKRYSKDNHYPYVSSVGQCYDAEGRRFNSRGPDLMAECTDAAISDANGWIEWKGGECPVEMGIAVDVTFRDGEIALNREAGMRGQLSESWAEVWDHSGGDGDIIAYRLAQPAKELHVTMEEDSLDATLDERGKRYGKFIDHSAISQRLKMQMKFGDGWSRLSTDQKEAMEMIAHKMARILNGDPNYADSWTDMAGYAKLVADRLQGVER